MDSIASYWSWIPPDILSALNFGAEYPEDDATDYFALGDEYLRFAAQLLVSEPDLRAVMDATQKFYEGEGAVAVEAEFEKLLEGEYSIEVTAQGFEDLGLYTRQGGTDIERTQIILAIFAGITAYTVFSLRAMAPWGQAAVPLALISGRQAVRFGGELGIGRLALTAGRVSLKNLLRPYSKQIVVAGLRMGGAGAGLELGVEGAQVAVGHRDGGIDWGQVGRTFVEWAAGGFAGVPAGIWMGHQLAGAALSPIAKGLWRGCWGVRGCAGYVWGGRRLASGGTVGAWLFRLGQGRCGCAPRIVCGGYGVGSVAGDAAGDAGAEFAGVGSW